MENIVILISAAIVLFVAATIKGKQTTIDPDVDAVNIIENIIAGDKEDKLSTGIVIKEEVTSEDIVVKEEEVVDSKEGVDYIIEEGIKETPPSLFKKEDVEELAEEFILPKPEEYLTPPPSPPSLPSSHSTYYNKNRSGRRKSSGEKSKNRSSYNNRTRFVNSIDDYQRDDNSNCNSGGGSNWGGLSSSYGSGSSCGSSYSSSSDSGSSSSSDSGSCGGGCD